MAYSPPALTGARLKEYVQTPQKFREEQLILDTGEPLSAALEGWQRTLLEALDAKDDQGNDRYGLLYWGMPKGYSKSTMAAGECLLWGMTRPGTRAYLLACDRDQAMIVRGLAEGLVRRNPNLVELWRVERSRLLLPSTDCIIEIMSSDEFSAHGLGALGSWNLFICDELWAWQGEGLWEAVWSAQVKRPNRSRTIVATNAGYDKGSCCYRMREVARTSGNPRFFWWEPGPDVRPTWIKDEALEVQRLGLVESTFQRLHRNIWTAGAGDVFSSAEISAVFGDLNLRRRTLGHPVAGVDLGTAKDLASIYVLALDVGTNEVVVMDRAIFRPSKERRVDLNEVEAALLTLCGRWGILPHRNERRRVGKIVCDPWQSIAMVQRLSKMGYAIEEFSFNGGSVGRLSQNILNLVRACRLKSNPDPTLEAELRGAGSKEMSYGWRLIGEPHLDALISVGMAAMTLEGSGPDNPWLARGIRCIPKSFVAGCGMPDERRCGPCSFDFCNGMIYQLSSLWWSRIGCPGGGETWLRGCAAGALFQAGEACGDCGVLQRHRGDPRYQVHEFLLKGRPFGQPPALGGFIVAY